MHRFLAKYFRARETLVKNFASDEVVIEPDAFMREEMEKAIQEKPRDSLIVRRVT